MDRGLGQERRERPPDERADRDDVRGTVLAGDRQVVDVEQRELRATAEHELGAVRSLAGLADAQADAVPAVEALPDGGEDRRLHGVRREVQRERHVGGRARCRRCVGLTATKDDHGRQDRECGEHATACRELHDAGLARRWAASEVGARPVRSRTAG